MTLETLAALVPASLRPRSGAVFYSGRAAFERPSDLYVLGLNPGGDVSRQAGETVQADIETALSRASGPWSAYVDERWNGRPAGTHKMQPRIRHLLASVGRDPRTTPASNVVFVRSGREADLAREKQALLAACWPFHAAVIANLGVRVVVCLGGTAGRWVRHATGSHTLQARFVESNARGWTSEAHRNPGGLYVLSLTHPSIAAWQVPATDPSPLLKSVLTRVS